MNEVGRMITNACEVDFWDVFDQNGCLKPEMSVGVSFG